MIQGKGWLNHFYPALAYTLLAVVQILITVLPSKAFDFARIAIFTFTTIFVIAVNSVMMNFDSPRNIGKLADVIMQVSQHPKIAYIDEKSGDIYPLTRLVGGEQVCRSDTRMLTKLILSGLSVEKDPARIARMKNLLERERQMFIEDMTSRKPDIVLIQDWELQDKFWLQWIKDDPAVAKLLSHFERVEEVDDIIIMKRRAGK